MVMENDALKKQIDQHAEQGNVKAIEEIKESASMEFNGDVEGYAENALKGIRDKEQEVNKEVPATTAKENQVTSVGGTPEGLNEKVVDVNEKIDENSQNIKKVETETEQKINEVKNGNQKEGTQVENQAESKQMTKEELRETLSFLQKCEIQTKNIKEIGNYSPEAEKLKGIELVLKHNENINQAPQLISDLSEKFKDFLNDKVYLAGHGEAVMQKHYQVESLDKAFPAPREITGFFGNDEETSVKFDTLVHDYEGWDPAIKTRITLSDKKVVLKDFFNEMSEYYKTVKPIALSTEEQGLYDKYQEAKKIVDSLPEDQKKEIEAMQKKVLQEDLKNRINNNIDSGKNLQYMKGNIENIDDFGVRQDLTRKLETKTKGQR